MLEIRVSDTLAIPSFASRLGDVTLAGSLGAATEAEAKAGVASDKWITPLRITNALREDGYINPKRFFGAKGDTVLATSVGTDDTTAFEDAIDASLTAIATGEPERAAIRPGVGNYRITRPLQLNQFGMTLKGVERTATRLIIDHADGPGVRFYRSGWACEDMTIVGSLTRAALALDNTFTEDTNIGLLLLGPAGSTANFGGRLINVVSQGHPADGFVLVGSGIFSYLAEGRSCKRHGIVIDAGRIVGLTGGDLVPQGFSQFFIPRSALNGGHSFVAGHPDDDNVAFVGRVNMYNLDAGGHATDAAARYEEANGFLHGEDIAIYSCGMQGVSLGVGSCWALGGKSIKVVDQRSVNGAEHTVNVKAYAGILAANIDIDIGRVITSGPVQDPAVLIDSGVPAYTVNVTARDGANITDLATTGKTALSRLSVQHDFRGGRVGVDSLYGTLLGTVGNNQVLKVQMNASIIGMFAIWASSLTGRATLVFAGVGSSPFINKMSESVVGEVIVAVGAQVAGAGTGTDEKVTISTHTDDCFYIKNKTGSSRTYHLLPLTQTNARVTDITLLT